MGGAERLRRKLRLGQPVLIAAIGASNTVRGGCEARQGGKCATSKYTNHTEGRVGWLLEAFMELNRSFPHAENRLINRAQMATGPEAFSRCLNAYLPVEADAVVISFADMCKLGKSPTLPLQARYVAGLSFEHLTHPDNTICRYRRLIPALSCSVRGSRWKAWCAPFWPDQIRLPWCSSVVKVPWLISV